MPPFDEVCQQAARAGGEVLLSWMDRFQAREKAPADLVSEADIESQRAIRALIGEAFPEHQFLGEESSDPAPPKSGPCWIVDPLDGTTNYVHGVPHFAVSVALVEGGKPLVGTVYDPITQECFHAGSGAGAWLNGKSLSTSSVQDLSQALVASSFPPVVQPESPSVDQFLRLLPACQAVRRSGSAALNLAYLAAGRYDGCWALDLHPWDVAAGSLLITEAGGVISRPDGGPFDIWNPLLVAASTESLHRTLTQVLFH